MPETQQISFPEMLKQIESRVLWKIALHEDSRQVYSPIDRSYYEKLSLTACKMEIRKLFKYATPSTVNNLTQALLEDRERVFDDLRFLESRKKVIGFLNGVYDLQTGKVRKYSNTDFVCDPLSFKIPYKLKDDIEDWFILILNDWVTEECSWWFLDLMAYLLFIYPNQEQIWVNFFGLGSNGKSVCEELFEKILGDEKVIGCDLGNINRFSGETFKEKWLVIGRDSSSFVSDKATSFIKVFSGDQKLLVEEKGGSSYDVYNSGKLIVSTNTLIQSKDRTYSWYRRLLPVPFPNTFTRDESFKKRLFSRLPDIVRLLLHKAHCYTLNKTPLTSYIPSSVRKLIKEIRYLNDRIAAFWELYFFDEEETDYGEKRSVNWENLNFLDGKTMSQVYDVYAAWHEDEFGETAVEPSLKTFGGQYGAFLQSSAGKIFRYRRTRIGRVVELVPNYKEILNETW